MYTLEELANKYGVRMDKMKLWLRLSKARCEGGKYAIMDLVAWHDLHGM